MDSITQAALGAAIGQAILGEKLGKRAALLGAITATIPDLDVILYAFYSPLEMLSIHRCFSHSILFSFIGAFILTFLLSRIQWTKSIPLSRMFLFTWLSLITHMLLDGCTAYGTQLLLPFSDARLGLDCINVVDPVYTLPLIIGLVLSVVKKNVLPNKIGLLVSCIYLLTTIGLKHTAVHEIVINDLKASKIELTELRTIPVGIASVSWYAVAKTADSLYLKKFSLIEETQGDLIAFPIQAHLLDDVDSSLANRMTWFSKGLYTVVERDSAIHFFKLQVDMRGVVGDGVQLSPTAGFFELKIDDDGVWQFGSGTVKPAHLLDK